jgi:hypothetical protein
MSHPPPTPSRWGTLSGATSFSGGEGGDKKYDMAFVSETCLRNPAISEPKLFGGGGGYYTGFGPLLSPLDGVIGYSIILKELYFGSPLQRGIQSLVFILYTSLGMQYKFIVPGIHSLFSPWYVT